MRNYKRKTNRGNTPDHIWLEAIRAVQNKTLTQKDAANVYNVNVRTLQRYLKKVSETQGSDEADQMPRQLFKSYHSHTIFTSAQEIELEKYLKEGCTSIDARKLAYNYAKNLNIKIPDGWEKLKMAGPDWLVSFLRRHKELSLMRNKPEAMSLAKASSFNGHNVELFFNNLEKVLTENDIPLWSIWSMDETGITTVQRPDRIIPRRERKQIGAITSQERGEIVTIAMAVSALGNSVPPFFIFPRVNFKDHFLLNAPLGSDGTANKSVWMDEADFLKFLDHFIKHARPSCSEKVLLLSHSSHLSVDGLNYAKQNGVVMLSFPAHCSHKLQPLDRSVYGPLSKYVNSACAAAIQSKKKAITMHDIPGIVATALPLAVTPSNIQAGFRVTGIVPFNRHIFDNDI